MKAISYSRIIIIFILIVKISFCYCQESEENQSILEIAHLIIKADSLFQVSNYESAIVNYKILSEQYKQIKKWGEYVRIELKIAQAYQIRGLFDSSSYFLNATYKIILKQEISDENLIGTYFYLKGTTYSKTGDLDSSIISLNSAAQYFRDGVNDSLQVLVKRSIGNIHFSKGELDLALKFYRNALIKEKLRNKPSEIMMAALFQNIGIVFSTTGNFDSARVYLERSIILKEKTLNNNDPQLAIGYLNFGRFLYIMGYLDQSLIYYTKAEEIYYSNFGKDYFGLAPIYFNKGSIFIILRDLNKALNYNERALELYLKSTNQKNPILGDIYINLGVICEEKGDISSAIYYYNETLRGNYNAESVVRSLRSLGRCYYNLNNYNKADANFKLSIIKAESFFGANHPITGGNYHAYGEFCISIKNYLKAEKLLTKAYNIVIGNFGIKNVDLSLVLNNLGDLYRNMGNPEKALVYYQKAMISNSENFNNENVYTNPSIKDLYPDFNKFVTLYKKANTLYDIYIEKSKNIHDLEVSLETGKLAITLFESILSSFKDENTKIRLNEYVYDIYNLVVLVATELYSKNYDRNYIDVAFEYTEKGKAAILLSSIRGYEAIELGNIPVSIREKEDLLKRDISLLTNFINDENQKSNPDSAKIEAWKKNIFNKTVSYDSLISAIEINYPQYYNFKYNFEVIKISEIQANLKKEEILIEYKIIDSMLIIYYITHDSLIFHKEILEADFNDKIKFYISSINQFPSESFNKEDFIEFIYAGSDLFRTLFSPNGIPVSSSKIIIIPDNILGYLPFEALIKEYKVPERIDFSKLDYVIRHYSLSYSYSGTLLFNYSDRKSNSQRVLAIAPAYSKSINQMSVNRSDIIIGQLNPLDYSKKEVNDIVSIIKGKVLIDDDATELNFKNNAEKYGILHFAMHTLINEEDPMASKLVFTLNNDTTEDGFLNAYEIYNLKLNARLAVLSACKTGTGKLSKGEGIMSLARGFLFAGITSIVMTLWEVEDVSGAEIMKDFYIHLNNGLSPDEALRKAKLYYLEQSDPLQSHPYFWAAYVQIGKTAPIISKSGINKIFIPAGIILVVIILYFLFRYRIRKKG